MVLPALKLFPPGWNETGRPVVLQVSAALKGPGPHGRRRIDCERPMTGF